MISMGYIRQFPPTPIIVVIVLVMVNYLTLTATHVDSLMCTGALNMIALLN